MCIEWACFKLQKYLNVSFVKELTLLDVRKKLSAKIIAAASTEA